MKNRAIPDQPDILTDDFRNKQNTSEVVLIQEEILAIENYKPDILRGMDERIYDNPLHDHEMEE